MSKIGKFAIVEDGAQIGSECVVEDYAFVGANVRLEDGVRVKQGARILGHTTIGAGSTIYSYAIVGDIAQDISYLAYLASPESAHATSGVIIGQGATIREFCTISAGTHKGDGFTRVGDGAFVMAYVHIAHDCRVGRHIIFANNATLGGHVEVGDYAVIGGMTPVHQFVRIGESCMIAGASALSQDIVPFCLAEGNRAVIRSLNLVGLRRRFGRDVIDELGAAYRFLFRQNAPLKELAAELLARSQCPQVRQMCEFILSNTRGIPLEKTERERA